MTRAIALLVVLVGGIANEGTTTAEPIPAERLDALHALIKPQPGEWSWTRIDWAPTLWEARRKAAVEGKPLFIWSMAGEPLGSC